MMCLSSIGIFVSRHPYFLVNVLCCLAFLAQICYVLKNNIDPNERQTHINVQEKQLKDMDFPVILMICMNPGFNITAIDEAGYNGIFDYFAGKSKYNNLLYGWAGHTSGAGPNVTRSVGDVAEKVILHTAREVLAEVRIASLNYRKLHIMLDSVRVKRMNFPYNCFTLDLTNNTDLKESGIKQLFLEFFRLANQSVEIYLQGKSLVASRNVKSHKFYSSGADIKLTQLGQVCFYEICSTTCYTGTPTKKSFILQIKENVFVEADSSKGCRIYPNQEFYSYQECDDQFMSDYVSSFDPSGLVPIWLTDNIENVSKRFHLKRFGKKQKKKH